MIGSLRVRSTPEAHPGVMGLGLSSPSPLKREAREGYIPFISIADSEGDDWPQPVSMTKEAQHFIEQIEGPICVLVCMGHDGTEKSSVIARVLHDGEDVRSREASPVDGPVEPADGPDCFSPDLNRTERNLHPRGIGLWPRVIKARTSDGADVNLVVLDVHDFDGGGRKNGRDTCLFSLGMLLSSFVVYHTDGGVTEEEISKLWSFVAATNKNVQLAPTHERDRDENELDFAHLSPKLLWVLQGFSLTRDDTGRQMTARQYLERALQEADAALQPGGLSKQSHAKTTLRHVFADRDCFPLVHAACHESSGFCSPALSPSMANDTSTSSLARGSSRERARAQVAALRDRILHNAEMKCIGGAALNGRMLLTVVESFISAINAGHPLNVGDAWCAVADAECEQLVQRCLATYNSNFEILRADLPLSTCDLSLWQMNSAREAIDSFMADARHLQAARVQRHRLRLEETVKGLWERISAENCAVGESKAQQLLTRLYQGVEQRLHGDEYTDFGHFDRERRRVRSEFLEKAPKQATALAVMYEFMEDEVAKVAKRFVSRVSMDAINCESKKDEELLDLKLQVADLTARLQSQEQALADSKARERKAREEMTVAQDRHAQEVLELDRGGSKALRELLADFEDAKRCKVEAELQLSHAVEKIEELSEWKQMNSSRAIWDAVEFRAQQAQEEEDMLKSDMAALLEAGQKNHRLLEVEVEGICQALLPADARYEPVGGAEAGDGWEVLLQRCPELARPAQAMAEKQGDMLARLVAVRAALDGGSRCPSCHTPEISATRLTGREESVSVGHIVSEDGTKGKPRRESHVGHREAGTSVALSPIDWVEATRGAALSGAVDSRTAIGDSCSRTPDVTVAEEGWFTPMPAGDRRTTSTTDLEATHLAQGALAPVPCADGGTGRLTGGQSGAQGSAASLIRRSPSPRPPLPPTGEGFRAVSAKKSLTGTGHVQRQETGSKGHSQAYLCVGEEVAMWEVGKEPMEATGARRQIAGMSRWNLSEEMAWEFNIAAPSGQAAVADAAVIGPVATGADGSRATLPTTQQQGSAHVARSGSGVVADTPKRIEQAFRALQAGRPLPEPASGGAPRRMPVEEGVALFSTSPRASAEGEGKHGSGAARQPEAPAVRMAARNSEDARKRISILARIEQLERSISDHASLARDSPAPSITSGATSSWELVESASRHQQGQASGAATRVAACHVPRATACFEGIGSRYTAYEVEVVLSGGQRFSLSKRYREFLDLHHSLAALYPHLRLPSVASKLFGSRARSWFGRFSAEFIETRRCWLDEYMAALVQDAAVAPSKILLAFLCVSLAQPTTKPRLDGPTVARHARGECASSLAASGEGHGGSGKDGGSLGANGAGSAGRVARLSPDMNGATALRERMGRE